MNQHGMAWIKRRKTGVITVGLGTKMNTFQPKAVGKMFYRSTFGNKNNRKITAEAITILTEENIAENCRNVMFFLRTPLSMMEISPFIH